MAIHTSITFECIKESDITYLEPPRPLRKEGHTKEEMGLAHALGGTDYALGQQTFEDWYTSTFPTATAPTEEIKEEKEPRKGDIKDHEYKGERFYTMVKQSKSTASCQSYNTNDEPLQYSDILDIAQQTDFSTSDYSSLIRESCLMATAVHLEKSSQSPEPQAPSPQPQPSFTREQWQNIRNKYKNQIEGPLSVTAEEFAIFGEIGSYLVESAPKPLPSRLDLRIKWWGEQERPSEITFCKEVDTHWTNGRRSPQADSTHYRRGTSEWISLEGVV